jgi:hypothetical protein
MTFVDDEMTVLGDAIVDNALANKALNHVFETSSWQP